MARKRCYGCGSSRETTDTVCGICDKPYGEGADADFEVTGGEQASALKEAGASAFAVILATLLGGFLGAAFGVLEMELPFVLDELLLGVLSAVGIAYVVGKHQGMEERNLLPRLFSAAWFGGLVGTCLFGIWWSFDPPGGWMVIGACAGFFSGLPIIISFGLSGGESKNLGKWEFFNVFSSIVIGAAIGALLCAEDGEYFAVPGYAGAAGLLPAVFAGKFSIGEWWIGSED